MKCSKCGYRAHTIAGLAKHYRKKHPGAMKRKKASSPRGSAAPAHSKAYSFCPHCGGRLG